MIREQQTVLGKFFISHLSSLEFSEATGRGDGRKWRHDFHNGYGMRPASERLNGKEQCRKMIQRGWDHGAETVRKTVATLDLEPVPSKIQFSAPSDEGETVDIESWFQRDFDSLFHEPAEMDAMGPGEIEIIMPMGVNCSQDWQDSVSASAVGVAVADILQTAGYGVRVKVLAGTTEALTDRTGCAVVLDMGMSPSTAHMASTMHPATYRYGYAEGALQDVARHAGVPSRPSWGFPLTNGNGSAYERLARDLFGPEALIIPTGQRGDNAGAVARRIMSNLRLLA